MAAEDYVVYDPMPNSHEVDAEGKTTRRNVVLLNDSVIKGAPHFMLTWYMQPPLKSTGMHVHDCDEFIGFVGSDPEDPDNLNATITLYYDGEWIRLTRSAVIYIPAGVKHCPYFMENITKPVIHFSCTVDGKYQQK
ncbi:MAG: hypothetical protein IKR95_02125 [Oscillospiraceae bacterium]|nr:hypothetical protein [Oscillospiraceae bacterium]